MNNKKIQSILVIAVHPDDETLGCGGTLLKHASNSDMIHWLIITNITEVKGYPLEKVKTRAKEITDVAAAYGFYTVSSLDYEPRKLGSIPFEKLVKNISDKIDSIKPEIIYINYYRDVHSDHQIVFNAIISASKNFRHPFIKKIAMYETLSETEFAPPHTGSSFQPNYFVNIDDYIDKKCEIMKIYKTELMDNPFPRSLRTIKSLAKLRGSRAGFNYAEAFSVLYESWD